MFGHSPIESDRDRRVKVLADNVAVSASTAQSEYARFLNFIGDRFTAVSNTVSGVKTYDIALKYADKIIPYEAGVAKGSTPGWLNFDGDHFDVSSLASSMYTVTSTGRVKVNAISTLRPLNVINTTNHTAVTVADNSGTDKIDMTFSNDDVIVLSNGTVVNTTPRRVNFSTDFTATDNSGSDRVDIALAPTAPVSTGLPDPTTGQYGIYRWSDDDAAVLEGVFNSFTLNDVGEGTMDQGDDADGIYARWDTGNDNDDYMEMTSVDRTGFFTRRDYNPHLYLKFKLIGSGGGRSFLGFHTNDPLSTNTDDYLNGASGFGLSFSANASVDSGVWQIRRNDGSGSTAKTSTGVSFSSGTLVTAHLWGNSSGWFYSINGGAASSAITTDVPAAATRMHLTCRIEELAEGSQTLQLYYIYYKSDK
jgi:hypothetical protein